MLCVNENILFHDLIKNNSDCHSFTKDYSICTKVSGVFACLTGKRVHSNELARKSFPNRLVQINTESKSK